MNSTGNLVDMPKFRSKTQGKGKSAWGIRAINLKFILASQQWATILLTVIFAVVPVGIIHWLPKAAPRHRSVYMYDATITYPMADHDSVPAWASYSIPFILLIITVFVGELLISRSMHRNITNALTTMLHFIVDAISAFFVALVVQTATKSAIGRLRPDFLDRCKPAQFVQGNYAFQLEIGHFVEPDCTETNKALLEDGRSSFPSGHANMSAVLCTYTAGYFLWTIYHRHRHSVFGAFDERKGWRHFLWKDLCHAIAMYWILLMLGLSWAIAGSRIVDNKHNPSDVVAGFFLGMSVAVVFLLRSIPCLKFIPAYDLQTHEAVFLRGGEADVGDNRLPEASQEMAELGQNGYSNQGQNTLQSGSSGYGPSNKHTSNAVHPSPGIFGPAESMAAQHSISLN